MWRLTGPTEVGPHTAGGGIIDADLQRLTRYSSAHGNDQLAGFCDRQYDIAQIDSDNGEIVILNDGSNGRQLSYVQLEKQHRLYPSLMGFGPFWVVNTAFARTTFLSLKPSFEIKPALFGGTMAVMKTSQMPLKVFLLLKWMTSCPHSRNWHCSDFYLQGGSLNVFTPNIGFDETGYVFEQSDDIILSVLLKPILWNG